jgi:hypothetical protein
LIPLWHVLLAAGLCSLRLARVGIFACLLGFSLHAGFGHRMLASEHFGPDGSKAEKLGELLAEQSRRDTPSPPGASPPLVLVSTAHDFNLLHLSDPSFVIARRTFDDREEILRRRLQAGAAYTYRASPSGPTLEPLPPARPPATDALTFEVEFDYPPEQKSDLWVAPEHLPWSCVSKGRALALHPQGPKPSLSLAARGVNEGRYEARIVGLQDGRCVERFVGEVALPGSVRVVPETLRNLSHIDRLHLTRTHP